MQLRNRVLLVEDDPACETILKRVVQTLDPETRIDSVDNAEFAALSLFQERSRGEPYNLVITDLFLTGKLTGLDLWRIYRECYPAPPVVITSSLPPSLYLEAAGGCADVPAFLAKPFHAEECRAIVKRFMASV